MKKFAYVLLIGIIIVLGFVIYSISASDTNQDIQEKVMTEIKYFESKIIYMFNSLNNIEFQNYKVSVEEISEEDKTQKFSLNPHGILNSEKEINWEYIKKEAETLQTSISTMILDLYKIDLNNNDILNFSKEYDNLLLALKNKNRDDSFRELVAVYSYFPKFLKKCDADLQTKVLYSTKYSIFKAYSLLDSENWDEIKEYLKEASIKFVKLLEDEKIENKNQFVINKSYILINELQNSANMQDKQLFLIKYRNLLEDLNNL